MNKVLMRPLFRKAYLKKQDKNLKVEKFKVGGFSQTEKRNLLLTPITSALLQARVMPGESQLGSLARAFGKGIEPIPGLSLQIKQLDEEAKAREDKRRESKLEKTKQVFDNVTQKSVFATESMIQNALMDDGSFRFTPMPEKKTAKQPMKVFDVLKQKEVFVNPDLVLSTFIPEGPRGEGQKARYLPIGKEESFVKAYKRDSVDGEFGTRPVFVTKSEVLKNPDLYQPVEGNIEMMLKVKDIERQRKQKNDADVAMTNAQGATELIRRIQQKVAKTQFTGRAADTILAFTGFTGFVDQFINRNDRQEMNDLRKTEISINQIIDGQGTNARITRALKAAEAQGLKTSIINLAYFIAKTREPGGRFSVADIELALKSIGESSNKLNFLEGLRSTGDDLAALAINEYTTAYDVLEEDIPNKYNKLLKNYDYFRGVEIDSDDESPASILPQ